VFDLSEENEENEDNIVRSTEKGGRLKSFVTSPFGLCVTALFCCMLWGSAFSGVKVGYKALSMDSSDWAGQMVFAGIRFFIAGLMAIAAGSISQRKLLLPTKSSIPKIGIISFFQTIAQYFFYYIGLAHTTGVKAAVIVAANVFAAILISALLFKMEKLTLRKITGCVIGFGGIILINIGGLGGQSFNLLGDGFIFLCTIASGFSSAFMKKLSGGEDPVMLSGYQFMFGGAVMWLFGAVCGGKIGGFTLFSAGMLIYLAFVSAAAYSLWAVLLKFNPVSKVAVYGLMNPVCGVIISAIVLDEGGAFGLKGVCALAMVCIGIYIVNRRNERKNS